MTKVLKVNLSKTIIGLDDGSFEEVDTSALDFIPKEGDIVEFYKSGNSVIVRKVEKSNNNSNNNHGKKVNRLTYALSALYVGGFGIHKFYAGKAIGIVYLLFCWTFIPAIVAVFEGISAILKEPDQDGCIYV